MSHYQGRVKIRGSKDGIDIVSERGTHFLAVICVGEQSEDATDDAQRIVNSWNFFLEWENGADDRKKQALEITKTLDQLTRIFAMYGLEHLPIAYTANMLRLKIESEL